MPSIDTVDSILIAAPAQPIFEVICDYSRMREWYPRYRVEVIGGGAVVEGARLRHELSAPGSPVKTRFTRTICRLDPPHSIEESYDDGDLVGRGRWELEPRASGETRVSFHCQVRSNRLWMHLAVAIAGERGHNLVYQQLLAALKVRLEPAPG